MLKTNNSDKAKSITSPEHPSPSPSTPEAKFQLLPPLAIKSLPLFSWKCLSQDINSDSKIVFSEHSHTIEHLVHFLRGHFYSGRIS